MKKIISLVCVCVMLFACTVPAYATETFSGRNLLFDDAVYDRVCLEKDAKIDICCNIEITKLLVLYGHNTIDINRNASLTGEDLTFLCAEDDNTINFYQGYINLLFHAKSYADGFEELLRQSGISYNRDGNRIVAGCSHSEWDDGVCTRCSIHCSHATYNNGVCTICGTACDNEFHHGKSTCPECGMVVNTAAIGSIFSEGPLEIVFGIAGAAIGFIVAMFIFRKKKSAPGLAGTTEKEIKDEE